MSHSQNADCSCNINQSSQCSSMASILNIFMALSNMIEIKCFFRVILKFISCNQAFPEYLPKTSYQFLVICIQLQKLSQGFHYTKDKQIYQKAVVMIFNILIASASQQQYNIFYQDSRQKMPKILEHFEEGNLESQNLVVFLQGWPDNAQVWDWINWKQNLADSHLLFINFPNTHKTVDEKWGEDFPQTIQDLKFTIDSIKAASKTKMLVCHDWGCFYGYMFDQKYPEFFKQIIAMDVPGKVQLKSIKQVIYVALYQLTLVIAFLIGGPVGKIITQKMAKLFNHNPPYAQKISSAQNYPYYYMFRNIFLSTLRLKPRYLKGYRPSVPCTYLYGTNKPFQFHGEKWLQMVRESGGEIHAMDAGHWFMKKYSKFITDLICRKLKAKL